MTIREVANKFDLTPDTLRYYEKVGLIGPINKNLSGIRDYQEEDLKRIEFVKCMRGAEIPINVLVEYMRLFDGGDETVLQRRDLLVTQREVLKQKLSDMQKAYDKLNYKIDLYDNNKLDKILK